MDWEPNSGTGVAKFEAPCDLHLFVLSSSLQIQETHTLVMLHLQKTCNFQERSVKANTLVAWDLGKFSCNSNQATAKQNADDKSKIRGP